MTDEPGATAERPARHLARPAAERSGVSADRPFPNGDDGLPTGAERLVWGYGDGSTLSVFDTAIGRLGGLLCWENYMPLARYALHSQGIDIYVDPTWDNSETWVPPCATSPRRAASTSSA